MSDEIEVLRVILVGEDGAAVGITEHSDGLPGRVSMPVRHIVADALACNAHALILSHNHPGGDPQPSRADIAATHQLVRAVAGLGVRVHDHVITASNGHFSFRAAGLL